MVIEEISREDVLATCRGSLGLPRLESEHVDDALLAGLLRRAAGFSAPCSRNALRGIVLGSLERLIDAADLSERIDDTIEGLLIVGDLLELRDVSTDDQAAKGTWVFPAPPCFVTRPGGSIYLTGTVPDQDTFLPPSLAGRVQHDGYIRRIQAGENEDLARALADFGLQQLTDALWLKAPRPNSAGDLRDDYQQRLTAQSPSGTIADLSIIDPATPVNFYKGRWVSPNAGHSGMFVGRRPQEFRAAIWGVVQLQDGNPTKFFDLPLRKSRWRGSDDAWHVQMALDHLRGVPQRYRRTGSSDEVRFDFFSPIPMWAQRRFLIFGRAVPRANSLMSFVLPRSQADAEEAFIRERLWLDNTENSR